MVRFIAMGLCLFVLTACEKKSDNSSYRAVCQAAEQGDAAAQYNLGLMYDHGEGVPKDFDEAIKWYRRAAEQGYTKGHTSLGWKYLHGEGVPQDSVEAVKWFRKAAEQGDSHGQFVLGVMHANGSNGVPKDLVVAYKWYNLAAVQGGDTISEMRDRLSKRMTPEQIAEAQKLSREFVPFKTSP